MTSRLRPLAIFHLFLLTIAIVVSSDASDNHGAWQPLSSSKSRSLRVYIPKRSPSGQLDEASTHSFSGSYVAGGQLSSGQMIRRNAPKADSAQKVFTPATANLDGHVSPLTGKQDVQSKQLLGKEPPNSASFMQSPHSLLLKLSFVPARGVPLMSDSAATSQQTTQHMNSVARNQLPESKLEANASPDSSASSPGESTTDQRGLGPTQLQASPLLTIMGAPAFSKAISNDSLVFVKFYSPRCPHCQAMAPAFLNVSQTMRSNKTPVVLAEVDCLRLINRRLCDDNVAAGYPTLRLFRSSRLIDEYHGPREAVSMVKWLERTVFFLQSPRVALLDSMKDVINFLVNADERPVVISAIHHNSPEILQREWNDTVDIMRENSAKNVAFAVVPDWRYLVGPRGFYLSENFNRTAKYGVPPVAVATGSARLMLHYGFALWWFDGVTGADSLSTFMHIGTLPSEGRATLTSSNVAFISATSRCLVLLFDRNSGSTWDMEEKVNSLGMQGQTIALAAPSKDLVKFRNHVGLPALPAAVKASDYGKIDLVLYRAPNSGVEKVIAPEGLSVTAEFQSFVQKYLTWGVNMTARKSAPAQFANGWNRTGLTPQSINATNVSDDEVSFLEDWSALYADETITEVVASTWSTVIERDGRCVLLLLYDRDCPSCSRFLRMYNHVADRLANVSSSTLVTRMNLKDNDLPPYVERPAKLPALYILVPGSPPQRYEGRLGVDPAVTFALYHSAPAHVKDDRKMAEFLLSGPSRIANRLPVLCLAGVLFSVGVWLFLVGLWVETRAAKRSSGESYDGAHAAALSRDAGESARFVPPFEGVKVH